jgi:hypothetical protein
VSGGPAASQELKKIECLPLSLVMFCLVLCGGPLLAFVMGLAASDSAALTARLLPSAPSTLSI